MIVSILIWANNLLTDQSSAPRDRALTVVTQQALKLKPDKFLPLVSKWAREDNEWVSVTLYSLCRNCSKLRVSNSISGASSANEAQESIIPWGLLDSLHRESPQNLY